jgi:hypothetical protein
MEKAIAMSRKSDWIVTGMVFVVILAFILIGALLFSANTSKPDSSIAITASKFNVDRMLLSSDANAVNFFLKKIGTAERQELYPVTMNNLKEPTGGAKYVTADGQEIMLSVWQPSQNMDGIWQFHFTSLVAGDLGGEVDLHRESLFPFRYGQIVGKGFFYYEFKWINTGWVITASTGKASSDEIRVEPLIDFVNAYPY